MSDPRQQIRTWLAERKQAYVMTFSSAAGQLVLQDLQKFCRGGFFDTCFDSDPRVHAALEGRREVYNRIRAHIEAPLDDLVSHHAPAAAQVEPPEEDDDEIP